MKKIIIIAFIYLSGVIVSYNIIKYDFTVVNKYTKTDIWTVEARTMNLCISSLSWVSVIAGGINLIVDSIDFNAPASW